MKDLTPYVKPKKALEPFAQDVIRMILKIPQGKVATYGQIAELVGKPNSPRQVGMILRHIANPDRVPWQRVIGSSGKILFPKRNKNFRLQRKLLEKEGVAFIDECVDLVRFQWRPRLRNSAQKKKPKMFSRMGAPKIENGK